MKFFDFLFNKPNDESAVVKTLPPIEQVVKESVEHLKKCSGTLTSEKLEAEAINLASYIFLRGNDKVQFNLDFLTKGLIDKIPSGDYTFADKVFPLMVKYGEGLYTEKHASFGKNLGYKLNVTIDPDLASFLKGYYKSVHKVNCGESKSSISKSNNAQEERVDLGLSSGILWALVILAHRHLLKLVIILHGEKESPKMYTDGIPINCAEVHTIQSLSIPRLTGKKFWILRMMLRNLCLAESGGFRPKRIWKNS